MDKDKDPQIRKIYVEIAELWPSGIMDKHGIKSEIVEQRNAKGHRLNVIRWDLEAMEELPDYMKVCYKALNDHLVRYTQALLLEAQWYYGGYMPSLDSHLKNAWISIGIPVGLAYAYLAVLEESDSLNHVQLRFFDNWSHSELFSLPSLIGRFLDDLNTSKLEMERGETVNTIQCYMKQEGVCEEEARDHIKGLISESWKKLNNLVARPSLPIGFAKTALAMTRCLQRMYQFGDWFGIQNNSNKDCVGSSLFNCV